MRGQFSLRIGPHFGRVCRTVDQDDWGITGPFAEYIEETASIDLIVDDEGTIEYRLPNVGFELLNQYPFQFILGPGDPDE